MNRSARTAAQVSGSFLLGTVMLLLGILLTLGDLSVGSLFIEQSVFFGLVAIVAGALGLIAGVLGLLRWRRERSTARKEDE